MSKLRLAILDLYDNVPNQGMRCIKDIVHRFAADLDWELYDVRGKAEVPDMSYDIYISTGGPGSPHEGDGEWDRKYFDWLQTVWEWNQAEMRPKKYVFFICHSFQMACKHFGLAQVTRRKSMSFGTFKVHQTKAGRRSKTFEGLPNPFWIADFRHWQVVEPNQRRFAEMGADILALEKIRPHVDLERAIMAVRFSPELIGVQFHPEADPAGMLDHFLTEQKRKEIVAAHGEKKYHKMITDLNDPKKIALTYEVVLPGFLDRSIGQLRRAVPVLV